MGYHRFRKRLQFQETNWVLMMVELLNIVDLDFLLEKGSSFKKLYLVFDKVLISGHCWCVRLLFLIFVCWSCVGYFDTVTYICWLHVQCQVTHTSCPPPPSLPPEKPELSKVPPVKPGVSQNIALHALQMRLPRTLRFWFISPFEFIQLYFFSLLLKQKVMCVMKSESVFYM